MNTIWVLVGVMSIAPMKNMKIDSFSASSMAMVRGSFPNEKACLKKVHEFRRDLLMGKITTGGVGCIKVVPMVQK